MARLILGSLALFTSLAFCQNKIIEAYGDSLTAGLLNYTTVSEAPALEKVSEILGDFTMFKLTQDREYITKHENPKLAWPQVLANQLETTTDKYEVRNYGISGARSDSLVSEVKFAQTVGPNDSVMAFFFIGHNDLCHFKGSVEALHQSYMDNFNKAVEEWDKNHSGAKAYFISVGEVNRIYPLLDNYIWFEKARGKYRCNESWDKLFPYCSAFYKKYREGTLDDYVVPRLNSVNAAIRSLADKWRSKSLRNQYFFIDNRVGESLIRDFFAVDCYHLSQRGQNFVADQMFKAMSWQ